MHEDASTRKPLLAQPNPALELGVATETGRLQHVVVHTPGPEMELVSPQNREHLLFEDILYVEHAREEHELMCAIFDKIVGASGGDGTTSRPPAVLQLGDLLHEAFSSEDARQEFVSDLCRTEPTMNLQAAAADLRSLSPEELHRFAVTGVSPLPVTAPPLPNLMFTRDLGAVVHDHIILSHPATAARRRESLVLEAVLNYHPLFADYREKVIKLPLGVTFEGGDLLVASPNVVLIGSSERTSFSGVMGVARHLFERTPIEHVIMVDLPKLRWCMHLDTIFTFSSPSECVVFPPLIQEQPYGSVIHLQPAGTGEGFRLRACEDLRSVLVDLLGATSLSFPAEATQSSTSSANSGQTARTFLRLRLGP